MVKLNRPNITVNESAQTYSTANYNTTVWTTWVTTASTTQANNIIWNTWTCSATGGTGGTYGQSINHSYAQAIPELTPEQRESERKRLEALQKQREEERRQYEIAKKTAKETFLHHLTEKQRDCVAKNGWFVVEGGKSKKKYRIGVNGGIHGNVVELDNTGKAIAQYCFQLSDTMIPVHDHFLAQKLFLEHDEEQTLKIANRTAYNLAA